MSKEVLGVSDVVLSIKPARDLLPGVDSLNVSVATGRNSQVTLAMLRLLSSMAEKCKKSFGFENI